MPDSRPLVLLLHGHPGAPRSGSEAAASTRLSRLPVRLLECDDVEDAARLLAELHEGRDDEVPVLVVTDADVSRPLAWGRRIVREVPDMRFLFLVESDREAALRRESIFAAPPGNRWQIATAQDERFDALVMAGVAAGRQGRRLRTTVERMRLRLPSPAPVDSVEYRRLVASDRYLASVLENAQDAIMSIDTRGDIVSWNRGAQQMFGTDETEVRGQRAAGLFDDPHEFDEVARAALSRGRTSVLLTSSRHGVAHRLEVKLDHLIDDRGHVAGLVVIVRDVSERERAEAALKEGSRQKDEFLAMLSHELRNPLAPVRNAAHLLQILGLTDPRAIKASQVISRQVAHMSALIDDLLDVARVTRGAVELESEPLSVQLVIAEAIEQTSSLLEAKHQRLLLARPGESAEVHGDRKRLIQVVANLLTNSSKFTPDGGEIAVELVVTADRVTVSVSDDGIGIDAQLLPHVFELFTQGVRSGERALGGLGIGLPLVRKLVELHGGKVEVHSAGADRGTSVRIELPRLLTALAKTAGATPVAQSASAVLNLMVVDDNGDAAESLGTLLETLGHRVEVYTDPRLALSGLASPLPDAFVLDIGMPVIDGYEMARKIRAIEGGDRTVLIALTGYGQPQDRARALESGFDHHLVKPVDFEVLETLLNGLRPVSSSRP